jgi:hypothetical protein
MSATVHLELARACDGRDLLEFLVRRGLAGELVRSGDHWDVEIGYARREQERLAEEVDRALRAWLAERDSPLVPTRLEGAGYVLSPPAE